LFTITSKAIKNATVLIAGDSKCINYASNYNRLFGSVLDQRLVSTEVNAGPADRTPELVARLPEIKALSPKQVLIQEFRNDTASGLTFAQSIANLITVVDSLQRWGIDFYFIPFYETSIDLNQWNNYFLTNYPNNYINTWDLFKTAGYLQDGVHPNAAGQDTLAKIIINSFKLSGGSNRYEAYNNLQAVTDAGNSTSNSISVNSLTTSSNVIVGSRIGIGTTSPVAGIHLNATSGATTTQIRFDNTSATGVSWIKMTNDVGGIGQILNCGSSSPFIPNGLLVQSFPGTLALVGATDIRFSNINTLASGGDYARFTGTGHLLVGTSTDNNASIQIAANTSSNAQMFFNGSNSDVSSPTNGMLWYNSTTHALNFRDNGVTTNLLGSGLSGSGTSGRVAYWNGSSSITSNSNFLFNGSVFSVGTTNTQGQLNVGGDKNLSSSGAQSYFAAATYTDNATAASGTSSAFSINYFAAPTIAATNTGVTFPSISTVYIDKPIAGTNATIQKKYALYVNGPVLSAGSVTRQYNGIVSNTTLDDTYDIVPVSAASGNVSVTLPSSATAGLTYTIKRTDNSGNTCTVVGTIDGATNYSLSAQYKYVTVTSNGSGSWYIIGNN
jgi:hypothetical protein